MTGRQSLLLAFARHSLSASAGMDRLQEHGQVSDLCVTVRDVAQADADRAIEWLDNHTPSALSGLRVSQI